MRLLRCVARLVAHPTGRGTTGSRWCNCERKMAHMRHIFVLFGGNAMCSDDGVCRGKPFQDVFLEAAPTLGRRRVVHPNKDAPLFGLECCGEIRSDASFSGA
ncbi:hypothetical protein EDB83DRAFT_652993 [Lactarius deliciosus]|nr:hypothetical protein EDB83DRAFT_652993 [Lactarius deliciosus]